MTAFAKTEDPNIIELEGDVEVLASAEQVYQTLNLRSPQNRYVRRNMSLTPVTGTTDQFDMVMPNLPDMVFHLKELRAEPHRQYELRCDFPGGEPIGILLGDQSLYTIETLEPNKTRLHCHAKFRTVPIDPKYYDDEFAMLVISLNDDLARLKALIEEGAAAAEKAGALDDILDFIDNVKAQT